MPITLSVTSLPKVNLADAPQQPAQPAPQPVARYITPAEKLRAFLNSILSIHYLE